jgi:uncharacterized iron-regulated membrane protein
MPAPKNTRILQIIKQFLHKTHLVIGLTFGFYFAFMGVTGALMVFRHEIDAWQNPQLMQWQEADGDHATFSLSQTVDNVTAKYPDYTVKQIDCPYPSAIFVYDIHVIDGNGVYREVFVNLYGDILGTRVEGGTFFPKVLKLHTQLIPGSFGELLIKLAPFFFIAIVLTGLWIWWPPRKNFVQQAKMRITIKLGAPYKRTIHDMHNAFGFWSLLLLLVISVTGLAIAWEEQTKTIVGKFASSQALEGYHQHPTSFVDADGFKPGTIDYALDAAKSQISRPGYTPVSITPRDDGYRVAFAPQSFQMHSTAPRATLANVDVDGQGNVVNVVYPEDKSPQSRILSWIVPIHMGNWAGGWLYYPVKVVYFLAALSPLVLLITGFLKYIGRRPLSGFLSR